MKGLLKARGDVLPDAIRTQAATSLDQPTSAAEVGALVKAFLKRSSGMPG